MKRGRCGVEYEDVKLGDGPSAARGAKVDVRYNLFLNRDQAIPGIVPAKAVLEFHVTLLRVQSAECTAA